MKQRTQLSAISVAFFALLILQACSDAPKGDQATITDKEKAAQAVGQNFVVDTSKSSIRFIGYGVGKNHPWEFRLASGNVAITGNQIIGGQFLMDVKSLVMEEKGAAIKGKLQPHLMILKANSDFNINRTQWQMNYGNDKTLGDKFISETVNIELDLEARKQ